MRNLDTPLKKIRREVFKEISKVAFTSTPENFQDEIDRKTFSEYSGL